MNSDLENLTESFKVLETRLRTFEDSLDTLKHLYRLHNQLDFLFDVKDVIDTQKMLNLYSELHSLFREYLLSFYNFILKAENSQIRNKLVEKAYIYSLCKAVNMKFKEVWKLFAWYKLSSYPEYRPILTEDIQ